MENNRGIGFYIKCFLIMLAVSIIALIISILIPKNVKVDWTDKDYTSAVDKLSLMNTESILSKPNSASIQLSLTSEELSALLTKSDIIQTATEGFISGVEYAKVNLLNNNELEFVFKLKEETMNNTVASSMGLQEKGYNKNSEYTKYFMKAAKTVPVYSKIKVEKSTDSELNIILEDIKLGQVSIPDDMLKVAQNTINKMSRGAANSIEKIEISEDILNFKGNISKAILEEIK